MEAFYPHGQISKKALQTLQADGSFPIYVSSQSQESNQAQRIRQTRKPINKVGKQTKQWMITRASWIRKNPPPIEGQYWECYLQIHEWCPVRIDIHKLTLDHVVSRTRSKPAL
jgi:hypothetical protein